MCYAYVPVNRNDLNPKFSEHNWWLPSYGELFRIAYYYSQYENAETNTEDNPLNIFYGSLSNKIISDFENSLSTSSEQTYNTKGNVWAITVKGAKCSIVLKHTANVFRPICCF